MHFACLGRKMKKLITDPDQSLLYASALDLLGMMLTNVSSDYKQGNIARLIHDFLKQRLIGSNLTQNTVWVNNLYFDVNKPSILLYSEIKTPKAIRGFRADYSKPSIRDEKLQAQGYNDEKASAVCLIAAFIHFHDHPTLPFNLCLSIREQEQDCPDRKITTQIPDTGKFDYAIIGQPTGMHLATAEKGNMILICSSVSPFQTSVTEEDENAIYNALQDILWFSSYQFPRISHALGAIRMTVTEIQGGISPYCIPPDCRFTVNIRLTDAYTSEDILEIIHAHTHCHITVSHINEFASSVSHQHPLVLAGLSIGRSAYTITATEKHPFNIPSVSMGPGEILRSGQPDEIIYSEEIH